MADEQFYTILTNKGKAKIANATLLNSNVTLTTLKVGDGNGAYYNPTEEQTDLKNVVHTCQVGSISIDKKNPNWVVVETIIPGSVGGFIIREIGLFDTEGDMIAVGKYPETYKPVVANGASKDLNVRTIFEVSNAENVTLNINPSVIIATKEDINNLQEQITDNATQLNDLANLNLFINGGFSVWQRGTSFSTNGYTADRWMYDVEGDDKGKIVRHANGGVQIKLISNKRFWFMQRIELNQELKNIFSNSTVTLSFYVTTSAGVKISPYIRVWSPSRNANIFLKSYEAKATRQLIECQITLGDLSSDDWLGIDIFRIEEDNKFTVGDDLYIRFENAKFELGSKATPFVPRPYGEELALCQRYYYRWGNERARYRAVGINGNQLFFFVPLPTTLRIIPTINNAFSINTLSGAGVSDFTFAVNIVPMGMIVHATKSTHGMSDGQLMLSDDGSLDAEIY